MPKENSLFWKHLPQACPECLTCYLDIPQPVRHIKPSISHDLLCPCHRVPFSQHMPLRTSPAALGLQVSDLPVVILSLHSSLSSYFTSLKCCGVILVCFIRNSCYLPKIALFGMMCERLNFCLWQLYPLSEC